MSTTFSAAELQSHLGELARKHRVVGAELAVLEGDEVTALATGLLNQETGVEVTNDSLFQIGSITKVFTTTLIMQLVDEGKIDLDKPVKKYLPEFQVADERATKEVTVRQLVTHSSGIDGDFFEDTGRGDDCVEKYVAACKNLAQVFEPGRFFSYCNAGFVAAGRLIEVVEGKGWDTVLKERLLAPLGMTRSCTLPEEALLHRAAVGHLPNPEKIEEIMKAPAWVLPRSAGPAGLINSTATELLSFARLHLNGGVAPDGTRVLSEGSTRAMQEPQVELPDQMTLGNAWGLGWILFDWDGLKVIGHDGGTLGQQAYLRIVPEQNFAVALLTNCLTSAPMYKALFDEIFSTKFGVHLPKLPAAVESHDFDLTNLSGVYQRENVRIEIDISGDDPVVSIEMSGILAGMLPPVDKDPLKVVDDKILLWNNPVNGEDTAVVFFDFDDQGRPRYLHTGGRAAPRIS